jgi:hypothetical protein
LKKDGYRGAQDRRPDGYAFKTNGAQLVKTPHAHSKALFKTMTLTWGGRNEGACRWQCTCSQKEAGCNSEDKCSRFHFDDFTKVCKLYADQASTPEWPLTNHLFRTAGDDSLDVEEGLGAGSLENEANMQQSTHTSEHGDLDLEKQPDDGADAEDFQITSGDTGAPRESTLEWPACQFVSTRIRDAGDALYADLTHCADSSAAVLSDSFAPAGDAAVCASCCATLDGCKFWTWGPEGNMNRCWLRTGSSGETNSHGFLSGSRLCAKPASLPEAGGMNQRTSHGLNARFASTAMERAANGASRRKLPQEAGASTPRSVQDAVKRAVAAAKVAVRGTFAGAKKIDNLADYSMAAAISAVKNSNDVVAAKTLTNMAKSHITEAQGYIQYRREQLREQPKQELAAFSLQKLQWTALHTELEKLGLPSRGEKLTLAWRLARARAKEKFVALGWKTLHDNLEARGLPSRGSKDDLAQRLMESNLMLASKDVQNVALETGLIVAADKTAGSDNAAAEHDAEHDADANTFTQPSTTSFVAQTRRNVFEDARDLAAKESQGDGVDFNLCATQAHNNLGGLGPDKGKAELRYFTVARSSNGDPVDLVITNTSVYHPGTSFAAATSSDCYGRLSIRSSTDVDLNFKFVHSKTAEIAPMSPFIFTMYDLDKSEKTTQVLVAHPGFEDYWTSQSTRLKIAGNANDGMVVFTAAQVADGTGNKPTSLSTRKDLNDAVTFRYSAMSEFNLTYIVQADSTEPVHRGRNVIFAGKLLAAKSSTRPRQLAETGSTAACDSCVLWGGPHVIPFDLYRVHRLISQKDGLFTTGSLADQATINDLGTYWLVNNDHIRIQGRYLENKTSPDLISLGALAVGGPFLEGNTLVIRPSSEKTTWNGKEVLRAIPSEFSNDLVAAKYHDKAENVKDGSHGPGIEIDLPLGVRLTVNRWKQSLAAIIQMCPQKGEQSGQCGNYNANARDDAAVIASRGQRVSPSEFLFRRPS